MDAGSCEKAKESPSKVGKSQPRLRSKSHLAKQWAISAIFRDFAKLAGTSSVSGNGPSALLIATKKGQISGQKASRAKAEMIS